MTRKTLAALACLLLAPLAQAQQDFSKVEIKTTKLGDNAYLMEGAGGNLGLSIGDDAVFLIDDQFAPLSEKISAAIAKLTAKPVKFILNTHWHYDHTGGNENFGRSGSVIVAHENVRKRMSSEQLIEFLRTTVPASPGIALPMVTFAASVNFHLNGEEIRAIHVPRAHTDGDAIVHFVKGDVVHRGDTYFNGFYPFIDTSSGGTIDGVVAYRDMLATVSARIRKMVADGRKLEDITASDATADFDEKWGKGFIPAAKFREMVAMNIIKNR